VTDQEPGSGRLASPEPPPRGAVPPQNLEAEEAVLGAMMISKNAIGAVAEILSPDGRDFYRESHAIIYRAALALDDRGEPVDAITLTEQLEATPAPGDRMSKNALDVVGGRVRLHELAHLVPASANAGHYAKIVKETATLRDLIYAGGTISRLGWDRPHDVPELVERAEQVVFDLSQARSRTDLSPARDIVRSAYDRIVELAEHGREVIGTPTGFRELDDLTSGYQPGNLVILAARPSMGKSALALCSLAHVSIKLGIPSALFTLEMSKQEVMQRLMGSEALVDSQKIRNGRGLDTSDWHKLTEASARIEEAPLYIDDEGLITVGEIRSKSRRLKLRHPDLGLVVVDYLQLMASTGSEENRVQQVAAISRSLKLLARELEVPVLALSQLSRAVEQRHDKRPILSDLRESGALEQDADIVAFVYRDEYYNPEDTDQHGIAEVNVAKQRNGPTGTRKLSFVKRYARFSDLHVVTPGTATHS
jgi:replicative DNA helicase